MPFALLFPFSIAIGFVLLWPIGWVFSALSLSTFHGWGWAHGGWLIAWPLLSLLTFAALFVVGHFLNRHRAVKP